MTSSPNSRDSAWVLEATIRTAPAADHQWREQLDRLRPIASYDPETQTWRTRLGALDLAGVQTLQTLFDMASAHGTEVFLAPAAVPEHWEGPTFTEYPDAAAVVRARTEGGRPLGQLPLA
ncbi:hypothetical protein [Streptomyces sp. NBC_00989]|uniref:hypothetical protein n=1 Tax=Streptomyces sp. NBC_00989 TaxID=2903705 RepID=UPI002F914780|nr:hypothetical protein OG714_54555 [Streptomyces sp. NBC_00989]